MPKDSPSYDEAPKQPSKHTLDSALDKVALGVAALHRAGPYYTLQSESFWYFAAGTWDRAVYDNEVGNAAKVLPERKSVAEDVMYAEARLNEAVDILQRDGDLRDAGDLLDAIEEYKEGERW